MSMFAIRAMVSSRCRRRSPTSTHRTRDRVTCRSRERRLLGCLLYDRTLHADLDC
jgi:hypothetical protein